MKKKARKKVTKKTSKQLRLQNRRKKKGECPSCGGKPEEGRYLCPPCAERNRKRMRDKYRSKKKVVRKTRCSGCRGVGHNITSCKKWDVA